MKEKNKRYNIIQRCLTLEDMEKHNPKWLEISDHSHKIFITGGSGHRKTNTQVNLTNEEPEIDKVYLYAKDPYKAKYQF